MYVLRTQTGELVDRLVTSAWIARPPRWANKAPSMATDTSRFPFEVAHVPLAACRVTGNMRSRSPLAALGGATQSGRLRLRGEPVVGHRVCVGIDACHFALGQRLRKECVRKQSATRIEILARAFLHHHRVLLFAKHCRSAR
jgi:hypothetical protein